MTAAECASLFDQLDEIVLFVQKGGAIVGANDAAARRYGWSRAELCSMTVHALRPPNLRADVQSRLAQAAAGEGRFETIHWTADRVPFAVDVSSSPVRFGGGDLLISIVREASGRSGAADALERLAVAQRSLDETEARLMTLLGCAKAVVLELSPDGRYLNAWTRDDALLARPTAELVGRSLSEILGDDAGRPLHDLVARVAASGRAEHAEHRVPFPAGARWFSSDVFASGAGATRTVVVVAQDITQRKRAEQDLRTSEERRSHLAALAAEVIFDWDAATDTIVANAALAEALLWRPEEVRGSRWWRERLHPDDRRRVVASIGLAIGGDVPSWSSSYRFRRGDGAWAEVIHRCFFERDEAGAARRALGAVLDVTAERSAQAAQQRLAAIVTSTDDAVDSTALDGVIQTWNPGAERLYGWGADEAIGRHASFLDAPGHPSALAILGAAARGGAHVRAVEVTRRRKDGSLVTVSISMSAIRGESGRVVGISAISRDLTEQKRLESRVRISERMASLGTLAAGVAHEINNPLTFVTANLELLAEDLCEGRLAPEERRALLDEMRVGVDRVRAIVRDLRAFSRAEIDSAGVVDVAKVVASALAMTSNETRHRARVVRRFAPAPRVWADEARLWQVFVNLVMNAAQAIPAGRADEHEIAVEVGTAEDGRASVAVRDTGPGISADALPRIFDPFFTTKRPGEGTGLGLSICRGIVSALGGELLVESQPGAGAIFRVLLPPHVGAAQEAEPPDAASPDDAGGGRVLVVDDEDGIRRAFSRVLGRTHEVITVGSGSDALALLDREPVDAIVCDVLMPTMTGVELYDELSRRRPELARRVVFMTGGALSASVRSFLETMPERCLEKPVEPVRLRHVIGELVAAARAEARGSSGGEG